MQARVISSILLKRLPRVFSFKAERVFLSSAAKSNEADDFFDNFVKNIRSSPVDAIKPRQSIKKLFNPQELNELIQKPTHSYEEISYIISSVVPGSSSFDISALCKRNKTQFMFLEDLKNPDKCLSLITLLINAGLGKTNLYKIVLNELNDVSQFTASVPVLNAFLSTCRRHSVALDKQTEQVIAKLLEPAIKKMETPAELLSAIHNFNHKGVWLDAVVPKVKDLLPVMNLSEIISTFRGLSDKFIKNKILMKVMAQRISESKERLTINQLVSLSSSCATLHFFDARIIRRLGDDLRNEVNLLNSWNDVSSLVNSFSRLNLGQCSTWEILSTWIDGHLETASVRNVSMVVSGMARMNIKTGKRAAEWLSKNLRREAAKSPFGWLSAIHSLAFYEVVPIHLAETVLSKDFIMELMKADITTGEKVYQAQKILQLQGIIDCMYGDSYNGPRAEKSSFGNLFSDENKSDLFRCKYRTEGLRADVEKKLFDEGLWMLAPKKYIGPSLIDQFGTYCDASVVVDKDNRLVPFSQWGSANPRPILFVSALDTTKSMDLNNAFDESILLGPLSICLRLLERKGFEPIAIFDEQLVQFSSAEEKLKFIKSKIVGN